MYMKKFSNKSVIYQTKSGEIKLRGDFDKDTIWATQKQIAEIFDVNSQAITKHIKNIYNDKELEEGPTCSILEQVQKEGNREVKRTLKFYNLDMIISVGYRVNSQKATQFRVWATKVLKQHITQGYTINKKVLRKNYEAFLKTVEDIESLAQENRLLKSTDALELVRAFSHTWLGLLAYDEDSLPHKGSKKIKSFDLEKLSQELYQEVQKFKQELMDVKQATELFAQEKRKGSLQGILGNVLQSAFGREMYPSVEEKAAHLLYFVVKNHPFNDGNKRTGAFAFLWFLKKSRFNFTKTITPQVLTALTLLVAESKPKDKDKMVGLILLLLKEID